MVGVAQKAGEEPAGKFAILIRERWRFSPVSGDFTRRNSRDDGSLLTKSAGERNAESGWHPR